MAHEKEGRGWMNAIVSFMVLVAALVLAYVAIKYLTHTDFNFDALLSGRKATQLP